MRTAAKRDDNERLIIDALEAAGCIVKQLSDRGLPDLVVMVPGNENAPGRVALLEVKGRLAKMRPEQARFFELVRGKRLPIYVVRSAAQALEVVGGEA